jgi:hypothetical protein
MTIAYVPHFGEASDGPHSYSPAVISGPSAGCAGWLAVVSELHFANDGQGAPLHDPVKAAFTFVVP